MGFFTFLFWVIIGDGSLLVLSNDHDKVQESRRTRKKYLTVTRVEYHFLPHLLNCHSEHGRNKQIFNFSFLPSCIHLPNIFYTSFKFSQFLSCFSLSEFFFASVLLYMTTPSLRCNLHFQL